MNIALLLVSGGVVDRGAESAAYSLAQIFTHLGHQVTLFQSGPNRVNREFQVVRVGSWIKPSSLKPKSSLGKLLERLNLNSRGIATLIFSLGVAPEIAKGNFSLVIPIDGFWEILACKTLQLFKQCSIMCIGLAGVGWTEAQNLQLKPDIFVALTQPMHEWVKKLQPKIAVVTIPLPVDENQFNTLIEPAQLTLNKPIVLVVAALTKYKRIDAVIRAVALLPEWSLLIIGQGEEKANLKLLAQEFIPSRFQIIEAPHESIASYYRACDVFVLASEPQEAFGMVLLEAQACGLPIVTTDDPSRRYILGDSASYANPLESDSLAQKISSAGNSYARSVVMSNLERFSTESIKKEYAKVFETLLD